MASSIDDLTLAYRVLAAPPPADIDSIASEFPNPLLTLTAPPHKTIGIMQPWVARSEPAVKAIFDRMITHLRDTKGYTILDIDIPYLPEGQQAHALTILGELASGIPASGVSSLSPHTKLLISVSGTKSTGTDYIAAQKLRNLLMCHLAHLFTTHKDLLILTPTVPIPGSEIKGGEKDLAYGISDAGSSTRSMEYVYLANFTGCPAINFPAGYVEGTGMPVGLMAMGEWGSEEALLAFVKDTTTTTTELAGGRLKTPHDENGESASWVDVIGEAENKINGSNASKL
jgi:Asp-tRNA(Asn)/Glu-tRNA(Gln) amidotransferase A subunit family amidase